jgi:hypothetical protein
VLAYRPQVELVPHREHEGDDGDLCQHRQRGQHGVREQVSGQVARQPPEQARPEQHSGQYLSDDHRLTAPAGQYAERRGNDDNQRDIAYNGRGHYSPASFRNDPERTRLTRLAR